MIKSVPFLILVALAGLPLSAHANSSLPETWPTIRADLFAARPIFEGQGVLELEAPVRAEDAALVPITVRMPAAQAGNVKSLTLVVDHNPAPIAATFKFGAAAGASGADRVISTRLRFDNYSSLRAVVEMNDGTLHMATRFVKAAGGCSAPALKDADEALANLGRMQVKTISTAPSAPAASSSAAPLLEAQVMVRHPNYSGMQMNQETGYFIPAKYVTQMTVTRGVDQVFQLEAGISLSADPNIRFTYAAAEGSDGVISVVTHDSDGRTFTAKSAATGS
jgi:sulfur-oxidizing protein SoxY